MVHCNFTASPEQDQEQWDTAWTK